MPRQSTTPVAANGQVPAGAPVFSPEDAVRQRYSQGAQQVEAALCCPVSYNPALLTVIPPELLERDYGCGDPTPFIRCGDTVLDLGSGGGKACYIAAQLAGSEGRVIGVDCNQEMLGLARRHQDAVAEKLGFANVEFRCGLIQDLRLDLDLLAGELQKQPVTNQWSWLTLRALEDQLRRDRPLILDDSIDCLISNCVLNLVRPTDRAQLFAEMFRVLKRHGRVAISDIVADEDVPDSLQAIPELWSGCISGAYREDLFLQTFENAGFHGMEIVKRQANPWRTVEGIEFRSITVVGYKGKQGPCLERKQALIYRGPFKKVEDDDGHVFVRGERSAVCDKTYHLLQREPYSNMFEGVEPRAEVLLENAPTYDCRRSARRHPRESKGAEYRLTTENNGSCCTPGNSCC